MLEKYGMFHKKLLDDFEGSADTVLLLRPFPVSSALLVCTLSVSVVC